MSPKNETPPENIGDRLVLVETTLAYLVKRQAEIEELTDATDRLAESTLDVEAALRTVGEVRVQQAQLAKTVRKVSRRKGRLVALAICIAILAISVVYGWQDRSRIHNEIHLLQVCRIHPRAALCLPHTTRGSR